MDNYWLDVYVYLYFNINNICRAWAGFVVFWVFEV